MTTITTHQADALARLLEQYKNSPRLKAIVSALAKQFQDVEDTLSDVQLSRAVTTAFGASLDRIGALVGFDRPPGTSDEIYRFLVLGKIGINVSQGETERVIDVYRLLTLATRVRLIEYPPAAFSVMSDGSVPDELIPTVKRFLDEVAAAGVAVLYFGLADPVNPLTLAGGDGGGLGDVHDPDVGGKFAQLLVPVN